MGNKRSTKGSQLRAYLDEARPQIIDPAERARIGERLSPVSESYLKELLRGCGTPLAPLVEGVRQDSMDALERTLVALAREYLGSADREVRHACRRLVIEAKEHGRWALRRGAQRPGRAPEERDARQADKAEMIQWMLVWLENPSVFETWARLRRKHIIESRSIQPE